MPFILRSTRRSDTVTFLWIILETEIKKGEAFTHYSVGVQYVSLKVSRFNAPL